MKRGITPIIATILLIVMTVGIAALMYAWMSGMFTEFTQRAGQEATGLQVSYKIMRVLAAGTNGFNLDIFNDGRVVISMSSNNTIITIREYPKAGGTSRLYDCTLSSEPIIIEPGTRKTVGIICNNLSINTVLNSYGIEINYRGISQQGSFAG